MDYNKQAESFLLSCNVTFKAEKAVPQLSPRWAKDGKHGTHYSITLAKYKEPFSIGENNFLVKRGIPEKRIVFSFWNSIKAKEEAEHSYNKSDKPKAYDVLSSIYMPVQDFEDFCSCLGYSEDSREAEATYKEVVELNKKLEGIFTSEELARLIEIQ